MGVEFLPLPVGRRNRGPLLLILAVFAGIFLYSLPPRHAYRANRDVTVSIYPIEPDTSGARERQQSAIAAIHLEAASAAITDEENERVEGERKKHALLDERHRLRDTKKDTFQRLRNKAGLERERSEDPTAPRSLAIVYGRTAADAHIGDWTKRVNNVTRVAEYVVDDKEAPLHLDENRGREAVVYAKYIIEHYDNLTDVTVFVHASNRAWHNSVLLRQDLVHTLNYLNLDHVFEAGYFNTRCETWPGCPNWIKFNANKTLQAEHKDRALDTYSPNMWSELFPGEPHPDYLAESCCSQFAVSKEAIRAVPKDLFERIYRWLRRNEFDMYSGRQMEYIWQYIFTGEEQVCPRSRDCYCKGYGLCFDDDKEVEEYNRARQDDDESWVGPDGVRWGLKASAQDTMKRLEKSLPEKIGINSKYAPFAPVEDDEPARIDDKKSEEKKPADKADDKKPEEKAEEKKPEDKADDKKPEEKAEEKKPEDKAEEKKPDEKTDEKKPDDKAEEKKPDDKAEEKKPKEKGEDKKTDEKTDDKKLEEKTEEKKPDEKAEEKKPDDKSDEKKAEEKTEAKPEDKAEGKNSDEKSDEKKTDEKSEEKSNEKSDEKKTDDKPDEKKPDEKSEVESDEKKTDDKSEEKKPDDKGEDKPDEKPEETKASEAKSKDKSEEKVSKEESTDKSQEAKPDEEKKEEEKATATSPSAEAKETESAASSAEEKSAETSKSEEKPTETAKSEDKPSETSKAEEKPEETGKPKDEAAETTKESDSMATATAASSTEPSEKPSAEAVQKDEAREQEKLVEMERERHKLQELDRVKHAEEMQRVKELEALKKETELLPPDEPKPAEEIRVTNEGLPVKTDQK